VVLDITTDESRVDLVAGGYDAGIHYGEFIEHDMVAVGEPTIALQHRCINFRHVRDEIYRWEFDKGKRSLTVAVNGPLIVDDVELVIRAALDGVGLAYLGEDRATPHLDTGALVRVLEQWCQPFPGFFFYYPRRRQQPAALSALIDALRFENPRK
jgi:DNA-binding transcriptional LysR family regulator